MRKYSKPAAVISIGMILFAIFLFLWVHPFLYIFISMKSLSTSNVKHMKWEKLAVKYSIFKAQKKYTMTYSIPSLMLAGEYDSVVKYVKELEKLNAASNAEMYFASFAYMQKEDFENALEYAKKANTKMQLANVYIKMRNIKNAEPLVNELLNQKPVKPAVNVYKAELEILKGNWKTAEIYTDKMLKINPRHKEALECKIKILEHFGKTSQANSYKKKLQIIELKYKQRIQD